MYDDLPIKSMMAVAAFMALGFGVFIAASGWLAHPHIRLTVHNDSSAAISDVRVRFLDGERTVALIEPGGAAAMEIQSGGESCVYLSYRDVNGIHRKDERVYCSDSSSGLDRGFLEFHIGNIGMQMIDGVHSSDSSILFQPGG